MTHQPSDRDGEPTQVEITSPTRAEELSEEEVEELFATTSSPPRPLVVSTPVYPPRRLAVRRGQLPILPTDSGDIQSMARMLVTGEMHILSALGRVWAERGHALNDPRLLRFVQAVAISNLPDLYRQDQADQTEGISQPDSWSDQPNLCQAKLVRDECEHQTVYTLEISDTESIPMAMFSWWERKIGIDALNFGLFGLDPEEVIMFEFDWAIRRDLIDEELAGAF